MPHVRLLLCWVFSSRAGLQGSSIDQRSWRALRLQWSHDSNKLDLRTGIEPELHVQLLWNSVQGMYSTEDFPSIQACPYMTPSQSDLAVVAYYDHVAAAPRCCRYMDLSLTAQRCLCVQSVSQILPSSLPAPGLLPCQYVLR